MGGNCISDNATSRLVQISSETFQSCAVIWPPRIQDHNEGESSSSSALGAHLVALAVKTIKNMATFVLQIASNFMAPPGTLY